MRKILALILAAVGIGIACGCGVNGASTCSAPQAAARSLPVQAPITNFFPLTTLARERAHWTFLNSATGEYTWFDFSPYDTFGYSNTSGALMHITKSADRAYWNPGLSAEVWQAESDDGKAIWSPGVIERRNSDFITYNMWSSGSWEPYYYLPDTYTEPFFFESMYFAQGEKGQTSEPLSAIDDVYVWPWRIGIYTEHVATPAFSGMAVVSHQCEGTHDEYEEKWKFAPNLGLVEIETIREHGENQHIVIQRQ